MYSYDRNDLDAKPMPLGRDKILTRWSGLKSERASWMAHWKEISNYLLPRNGRYFRQDRNKGGKRHNLIIDNSGTRALQTLAAGMLDGTTSPSRPWFRLGTGDMEMNDYQPVRVWLNDVVTEMQSVFQRSNTYRTLHGMYEELGAFGTAATIMLPDYSNVIHHYPSTVGEYCIAEDAKGSVCSIYREFEKTVAEIVKEFGYENCSITVKNLYNSGNIDAWVPIIHAVEPRADRDYSKIDAKNMQWGSYYFEIGGDDNSFLRESGYKNFPALVPRWSVSGMDIYGNSPAMESLGDIKQLQNEQKRKGQCIDLMTKPPLVVPANMRNDNLDVQAGGVSYESSGNAQGVRTAYEVNININHLLEDINDCRTRVKNSFYYDVFMMISNANIDRMTATEVAERHEEKMLMLGTVIGRIHNELLEPLIVSTFQRMLEANMLPEPPEELSGMDINIEFVSTLAQAQRMVGLNSMDRMMGNIGEIAKIKPEVLDKIDSDEWVDRYSDMLGVDPRIIIANDKVALIRKARNEAEAARAEMAQIQQQAAALKTGAEAEKTQSETAAIAGSV